MDQETEARNRVVEIARSFIGTPFRDRGIVPGPTGALDCAGLLFCTYRDAGLIPADSVVENYSSQWLLNRKEEKFIEYVIGFGGHEITADQVLPGDIAIYKPKTTTTFGHGAIIVDATHIVHAYKLNRMVVLSDRAELATLEVKYFSLWGVS